GPKSLDGKAVLARIRRFNKSYKDAYKILLHTGSGTNENGERDRNTDVANPGNSCGNTIPLVAYTSSSSTPSVASSPSAGPSSPSVITQRHTTGTSHSPSSTRYSGKKKIINDALFGHGDNDTDKMDELAENYVKQMIDFKKSQDEANRHIYEEHLEKQREMEKKNYQTKLLIDFTRSTCRERELSDEETDKKVADIIKHMFD
ncbi:hypothetical protein INT46_004330, partial [Mucor plumbeus]